MLKINTTVVGTGFGMSGKHLLLVSNNKESPRWARAFFIVTRFFDIDKTIYTGQQFLPIDQ